MRTLAVAGLQMRLSAVHNNLPAIRRHVAVIAHHFPWVRMVVLSELAACGIVPGHAEPLPGPNEAAFQDMARTYGLWLVTGSLFETAGDKLYNTASVIDPTGAVVGRYRKMFPFRPYEAATEAGDRFFVFDVPGVARIGMTICYDLWFPEVCRTLAAMGAEVVLRPALTNTSDREIELVITRAMAAVNQCYILDINGLDGCGNGRSLVVDPEGTILHQAGEHEEIIALELDIDKVTRVRERGLKTLAQTLKSFRDRKVDFDLYRPGAFDLGPLTQLGPLVMPPRLDPAPGSPPARPPHRPTGRIDDYR